jgi:hypothetical protein
VAGSGDVVSHRLGSIVAEEDCAGVADRAGDPFGTLGRQLEVLGCPPIGDLDSIPHRPNQNDEPVPLEGHPRNPGPGGLGQGALQCGRQRLGQIRIGRHAPAGGVLIVLRLSDHVGRYPLRVGGRIGDYQHLGGAGDHVYTNPPDHLAFGFRDPAVARSDDLVHPGDRVGAKRQRRNGLGATDPKHPGDPGQGAGRKDNVRGPLGRHHGDDLLDPRHQGRHRVHHHGRRIGRLPAGHVQPDPVQRGHFHSNQAPVGLREMEPGVALALMVLAHPVH